MTDIDNTYFGRREEIAQSVAKSYANEVQSQIKSNNINIQSYLSVKCGETDCGKICEDKCSEEGRPKNNYAMDIHIQPKKPTPGNTPYSKCIYNCKYEPANNKEYINCSVNSPCFQCLSVFMGPDQLIGDNYLKNYDVINMLRTGVCAGLCACSVENIYLTNSVIADVNSKATILNSKEIKTVAKKALKDLSEKYGSTQGVDENDVLALITEINTKSIQEINQSIVSIQGVTLTGSGITVRNISMQVMLNAVMRAIASVDSAVDILNKIVQQQMSWIKQQVDQNVKNEFAVALNATKPYLIVTGLIIFGLMFVIVGLLMYRAMNGRK